MEEQSYTLLESIMIASQNSLLTNEYLDNISQKRLLNNANMVNILYNDGKITDEVLKDICEKNDIFRINIFNNQAHKIFSSYDKSSYDVNKAQFPGYYGVGYN